MRRCRKIGTMHGRRICSVYALHRSAHHVAQRHRTRIHRIRDHIDAVQAGCGSRGGGSVAGRRRARALCRGGRRRDATTTGWLFWKWAFVFVSRFE